jgi:ribosomal protein S18 acetylase RimI-like enzyme
MKVVIRRMKVADMDDVKRVDLLAWGDLVERMHPYIQKVTPRTDLNLLSYLRSDPEGSVVAVDDHAGIVGSSFSHIWGRTGWVGPISVLPSYQGRAVGKTLLRHSLRRLESRGCTDIGLESSPEVALNVGMYLRAGLRPEGIIIVLGRALEGVKPEGWSDRRVSVERLSDSKLGRHHLTEMRRVSNALKQGLDYTPEVTLTKEFSLGDTLVARSDGEAVGFCVVHTSMRREGMECAAVRALCVAPPRGVDVAEALLSSAEVYAAEAGSPEILVPAPGGARLALDVMFSRGYSVVQTLERFMWLGDSGLGASLNMCSWSG